MLKAWSNTRRMNHSASPQSDRLRFWPRYAPIPPSFLKPWSKVVARQTYKLEHWFRHKPSSQPSYLSLHGTNGIVSTSDALRAF